MCNRKPSQTFFFDLGAPGAALPRVQLLDGAGVLTDYFATGTMTAGGVVVNLLDTTRGESSGGKILMSWDQAPGTRGTVGMNLEFEKGLAIEVVGAGPNFGKHTIGAYITNDSPDPLAVEFQKLRKEVTEGNKRLYDFLEKLFKGDPAV